MARYKFDALKVRAKARAAGTPLPDWTDDFSDNELYQFLLSMELDSAPCSGVCFSDEDEAAAFWRVLSRPAEMGSSSNATAKRAIARGYSVSKDGKIIPPATQT